MLSHEKKNDLILDLKAYENKRMNKTCLIVNMNNIVINMRKHI